MPIAVVKLTSAQQPGAASSFATASVSPAANALELFGVLSADPAGTAPAPTVTGCALTWVQVDTVVRAAGGGYNTRLTVFRALGASPSTGALTIDFAGDTQDACSHVLLEDTGTDTSGTNGSGALVQSVNGNASATSLTLTLATFGSVNNRGVSFFWHNATEATTPRTNWAELSDDFAPPAWFPHGLEAQWSDVAADEATASASWASGSNTAGIAVEVAAAAVAAPPSRGRAMVGIGI